MKQKVDILSKTVGHTMINGYPILFWKKLRIDSVFTIHMHIYNIYKAQSSPIHILYR